MYYIDIEGPGSSAYFPKQDVHSEVPRLRLCERALHPSLAKIHLQHRIAGRYQCCNVVGAMPD